MLMLASPGAAEEEHTLGTTGGGVERKYMGENSPTAPDSGSQELVLPGVTVLDIDSADGVTGIVQSVVGGVLSATWLVFALVGELTAEMVLAFAAATAASYPRGRWRFAN